MVAPRQCSQDRLGFQSIAWLAECLSVQHHRRVHAEHALTLDRARLAKGILAHERVRIARAQLLDGGRLNPELHPELLEDRPPPG